MAGYRLSFEAGAKDLGTGIAGKSRERIGGRAGKQVTHRLAAGGVPAEASIHGLLPPKKVVLPAVARSVLNAERYDGVGWLRLVRLQAGLVATAPARQVDDPTRLDTGP